MVKCPFQLEGYATGVETVALGAGSRVGSRVSLLCVVVGIMSLLLTNPRWLPTPLGVKVKALTVVASMVCGVPLASFRLQPHPPLPPRSLRPAALPPHRALTLPARRPHALLLGESPFCQGTSVRALVIALF